MALKWKAVTVGPFAMNAYWLWCDETNAAILIDPGDEIPRITGEIAQLKLLPERIILTHAHLDHVMHAHEAQTQLGLPLYMHRDDLPLLENLAFQAASFGFPVIGLKPPRVEGYLNEGDTVTCGNQRLHVKHGPGHSPGSIMLIGETLAVVGDVLFQGSIGRTDLPGGSYEVLMKTIHEKLMVLDDRMIVLPGHGDQTTIGFERRNNPFLQNEPLAF